MEKLKLTQLLCSRICHDLITPVGAINNGFEFLDEKFDKLDPELCPLMQKSAQNAAQRLMIVRAGYSYAGQNLLSTFEKTYQVLSSYLESHNIRLIWPDVQVNMSLVTPQEQPLWSRVFVNLAAILAESAPKGGELSLSLNHHNGDLSSIFTLKGDLIEMKQENLLALGGQLKEGDITAQSVLSYITSLYMEEIPLHFNLSVNSKQIIQSSLERKGTALQTSGCLF